MSQIPAPRFATTFAVEAYKLRRSLALVLAVVAPLLIAFFMFFNLLRMKQPMPWEMALQTPAAIWAFFMLPMSVTALTALVAHTEHGPRAWDHLRALPLPRWHLYAAKALCVLGLVAVMTVLLALLSVLAAQLAGWWKPAVAATGTPDLPAYALVLARIFMAAWLLVAVQLWLALRLASFVPALATGIGGTFFAVVATSAKAGMGLPWQLPVNQLAADPARADFTLALGAVGGAAAFALMLWCLGRREVLA
ncbi:ABC transporter permease [Luteimonas sp. 50]|uniref:ABC transporter permease n=1 Tax=Cognatiluteimonas sedimenti TaxID=2927791 RepID=A0ABT0A727_9GAMM|nr:ABC transporter permease [Lysobacter sedimenti]MCJ0826795.1 ABC transporter permease [Lysobacter sedimenti]